MQVLSNMRSSFEAGGPRKITARTSQPPQERHVWPDTCFYCDRAAEGVAGMHREQMVRSRGSRRFGQTSYAPHVCQGLYSRFPVHPRLHRLDILSLFAYPIAPSVSYPIAPSVSSSNSLPPHHAAESMAAAVPVQWPLPTPANGISIPTNRLPTPTDRLPTPTDRLSTSTDRLPTRQPRRLLHAQPAYRLSTTHADRIQSPAAASLFQPQLPQSTPSAVVFPPITPEDGISRGGC